MADLGALGIGGYRLEAQRVSRQGLAGTQLRVLLDSAERPARHLSTIERLIGESSLPERVKGHSVAAFRRLAQAEATAHGVDIEESTFTKSARSTPSWTWLVLSLRWSASK